ncbi:MAG: hypothetical protein JNL21_07045 [Myxococcales bacterium]|nr:hypothetical protein [Myxococcales bacterium]
MSSVTGKEQLEAIGLEWDPAAVASIDRALILVDDDQETEVVLSVLFQPRHGSGGAWPRHDAPFQSVDLRFRGARRITMKADAFPLGVRGFAVDDISERGWEGVRLEVQDYESGSISFVCRSLEIAVAAPSRAQTRR